MRLWKAATLTTAAKAYWVIGALIATLVTARYLGPNGRGVIAAATSWVAMFFTFGHLSLAHVMMYVLDGDGRARVPAVTGSLMAITAAVTLLAWAIVGTLHIATGGAVFEHIPPTVLLMAFAGLPCLLWMEYANSLLVATGHLDRLNVAQIAGTTTGIVLVVSAVAVLKGGPAAALAAIVASYVVTVAIGLPRILAASGRPVVSGPIVRQLLHGGARLHLSAVGTFFFTHAGVILLNHFRPVREVGYFQLAMQLAIAFQLVPMAMSLVSYSVIAREGPDAAWPEHRRLIGYTMSFATAAAAGSALAAPWIVALLAGPGFAPAVPLVRILSLSVPGAALATVMAPQWATRGFFLQASMISLAAVAVGAAGNWVFIPRYGMYACAWAMVAGYGVHLAANAALALWIERGSVTSWMRRARAWPWPRRPSRRSSR
jgi:O-antigen/teichoic acid export membrane protein